MSETKLLDLPLAQIHLSRWQYRRHFDAGSLLELAQSIQSHGLINRLLVFQNDGGYELIAGERRLRALCALALASKNGANLAGAVELVVAEDWRQMFLLLVTAGELDGHTAPCELRPGAAADFREIVLLENLQREDPGPVEEAEAFRALLEEEGYTQASLAKRLGKSQAYISQRLGLLGLAEEVRQVVEGREISFTAARSIATLPAAVQPAVTAHVQQLASIEGDSHATSRKVQALIRQINAFLDPGRWLPPEGKILTPVERNRLRLVHHYVSHLDPERAGQAVIGLRSTYMSGREQNLVGKEPLTLARDGYGISRILYHLSGEDLGYNGEKQAWQTVAPAQGWTCQWCRFREAREPSALGGDAPCARWMANDDGGRTVTCLGYIGPEDPVVLPLVGYELSRGVERLGLELDKLESWPYTTDFEQYAFIHEQVAARQAAQREQQERARTEGHLQDLCDYWAAQGEGSPFGMGHPQAHSCLVCLHFRPELQAKALPPCRFTAEPLQSSYLNETAAPGKGVLVREDGLLVPRCACFQVAEMPAPLPMAGVVFPDAHHGRVLDWLLAICKQYGYSYNHTATVHGALAWLPYDRGANPEKHNVEKAVRYVRDHWQECGRAPGVARLLSVAASEAQARAHHREPVELANLLTGEIERWRSISWEAFVQGKLPHYERWPEDWPAPWRR